jgi:hypothetical protein
VFHWIPITLYEHYTVSVCDSARKAYVTDRASPVNVGESGGLYLNRLIKKGDVLGSSFMFWFGTTLWSRIDWEQLYRCKTSNLTPHPVSILTAVYEPIKGVGADCATWVRACAKHHGQGVSTHAMYYGGPSFTSWPGYWVSWLRFFVVFHGYRY